MTMTMKQLKSAFKNGQLPKAEYISQMHDLHKRLFEYADFIADTDIRSIEIADGSVIMTMRESGIRMLCDADDKRIAPIEILNFDHYEKDDFRMIMRLIGDSFSVFDIGGNFGWYSISVSKAVPSATIHTFEPIPKTFGYLRKNIELNNATNVHAHNFGFSNKEQDLSFYYYPEGSGNASMADLAGQGNTQLITCHVKRLDDFVRSGGHRIDFIKCDVEGAELFVFQGGIETIRRDRPIIFAELLRKWAAKFDYHPNAVIELLKNEGYGCFTVAGNGLREFGSVNDLTEETNYFFLHKEKHSALIKTLAVL